MGSEDLKLISKTGEDFVTLQGKLKVHFRKAKLVVGGERQPDFIPMNFNIRMMIVAFGYLGHLVDKINTSQKTFEFIGAGNHLRRLFPIRQGFIQCDCRSTFLMDALVSSNASMIGKPFTSVSPSSFSRCKMTSLSCSASLESCWPPRFGSLNEARHSSLRSVISMISISQRSCTPAVCLGCVFNIYLKTRSNYPASS